MSPDYQFCNHKMTQTLKEKYLKEIRPTLQKELKIDSVMAVPKVEKITVNTSSRDFKTDKELLAKTKAWLSTITGQAPLETKSRSSIAAFNLREGEVVGLKVTLRGNRMYDFLDRLITVALPRVRDFRGVSGRSFDGRGNYNIGVKEQIIFPEIEYDKIDALRGMNISITTSALNDDECKALLTAFRFPFKN